MAFDPESATEFKLDIPKNTIRFGGATGSEENFRKLAPSVQQQLIDASVEYHAQTGRKLQVNSGYRSEADQKRLYDESIAAGRPGKTASGYPIAKPGTSKHQRGIVIDVQQGKDDPVAQQILATRGFVQNVPNDPVHFEYTGKPVSFQPVATQAQAPAAQPQMAAGIKFDPSSAQEFVEPAPVKPQPESPSAMRTAQAGLAGITQGTFAGLGQYPAALGLSAASYLFPQGQPLSPSQALSQVRESQQSLKEEAPLAYTAGEIGGTIAGFGKLAGLGKGAVNAIPKAATPYSNIPLVMSPGRVAARETGEKIGTALRGTMEPGALVRGTGVAAGQGFTQEYTKSPETTAADAALSGLYAGGTTLALGGAGKAVEAGLSKIGERALSKSVQTLIDSGTPEARQGLTATFGRPFQSAREVALEQRPTMEGIKAELAKTGTTKAGDVLNEFNKRMSAWKKSNAGLKDIESFSQRYADNPALLQKYVSGSAAESTTGFAEGVRNAAGRLQSLQGQAFGQQLVGQALTLGGLGGLGAGAGALYGYATGQDPLSYAIGGGGGLPLAAAAAKFGGTRQFLNPTTMGSTGGMAAGTQGYRLTDLIKPQ
jgi:hypothetical protein